MLDIYGLAADMFNCFDTGSWFLWSQRKVHTTYVHYNFCKGVYMNYFFNDKLTKIYHFKKTCIQEFIQVEMWNVYGLDQSNIVLRGQNNKLKGIGFVYILAGIPISHRR